MVFIIPLYQHFTLEVDLFGPLAKANAIKCLSPLNADLEGHMADWVADALFQLTSDMRMRRKGESVVDGKIKLISRILDGRGELVLNPEIIRADRGNVKEVFINL